VGWKVELPETKEEFLRIGGVNIPCDLERKKARKCNKNAGVILCDLK